MKAKYRTFTRIKQYSISSSCFKVLKVGDIKKWFYLFLFNTITDTIYRYLSLILKNNKLKYVENNE